MMIIIITGNTREILRAEPETFIHIFVHKKNKLIEFLEHMTKVSYLATKTEFITYIIIIINLN